MKRLIYVLLFVGLMSAMPSCKEKKEPQKWEYKTYTYFGSESSTFWPRVYFPKEIEKQLDTLGSEGWELVSVVPMTETVHPNFGNEKYVTGLQPNTRTEHLTFYFKRPKVEVDTTAAEAAAQEEASAVPTESAE